MNTLFHIVLVGLGLYIIYQINGVRNKMGTQDETTLDEGLATLGGKLTTITTGVNTLKDLNKQIQEKLNALSADNPDLADEIAEVTSLNNQADAVVASFPAVSVPTTGGATDASGGAAAEQGGGAIDAGNDGSQGSETSGNVQTGADVDQSAGNTVTDAETQDTGNTATEALPDNEGNGNF